MTQSLNHVQDGKAKNRSPEGKRFIHPWTQVRAADGRPLPFAGITQIRFKG
ncbi:hypothetical protein KNP414_06162 [Paenibacillus mucilaginosus KNP414]|uniref:Uncharacterized protein n=1 Tax=Paenibacillus mucilaginosus (strain KNP414) TaxID=1036673 RepID=F8FIE3_PAEMK|nr:hypothetical protein KNP414_06162 [Paenibacillus mucilaginosus KNP414]